MNVVDPADTALLVTRALRKASTVLAVLVTGFAADHGGSVEAGLRARGVEPDVAHVTGVQHIGVALAVGLVLVLVLHVAVGVWARRKLADRLDREWAAVEPRWSRFRTP